jgi:hypothetical protein
MLKVTPIRTPGVSNFEPRLTIVRFIATRMSDPVRGPLLWIRPDDARIRNLIPGEIVQVITPRRRELATLDIDETLPEASAIARDIPGVTVTETVLVEKYDPDASSKP